MATIIYAGILTLTFACLGYLAFRKIKRYKYELEEATKSFTLAMEAGAVSTWKYSIGRKYFTPLIGTVVAGEGFSWNDSLKILHPDDHASLQELFDALCSSRQEGGELVLRYFSPEHNDYRYYESKMSIRRNAEEIITHIIGTQHDITQHLQLQHHLEQVNKRDELILNNVNSGLAYIGANYVVAWENMASCSASLSYEAYKKGEFCYKSAHGRNEPCENCVMKRALQFKQVEQIEFTFANGKSIEVFATPVFTDENEVEGVVIRIDNITERKMMITALEQAKAKAEDSDRLKSAFLANMSHEIRTPLNAIVGFSDLLLVTEDEEEKEQYGKIIAANNELLLQLINDILDLSKMESGMLNLNPQEVDLTVLFDELATTMRQRVKKGVELTCNNPYASCIVRLDPNRLTQVVTNFATNATKFTLQGQIKMGYEYVHEGIRVYVSDTGIGIEKDKMTRVFKRFEKLNDFAQGTGLGLSICKAIAEAHNGTIGVDSTFGEGSTFWAWIPTQVTITEKNGEETLSIETHHPSAQPPLRISTHKEESNKKNILVAEDVDSNYLLVSSILQNKYNLCHAANGAEAVEAIRKRPFDLILMDMKMPEMNGIEATQEIRTFNTTTPIVALTAHAFDSDRKAALAAGCNEYVVKPINRKQLFDALKKYV